MSTKLDIFSDPVCPWCYIGKARLERALEQRPDHPFIIEWHPFMLAPDMPPEGMDRREYLQAKFGPPEQVAKLHVPILEACEEIGLPLALEKMERNPSTLNAHRLIHWAGLEGRQHAVVSALFRANFAEGRDIGDREVLLDIAEAAGLDRAMTARLLDSDADVAEIRARDADIRARGLRGVPGFLLGRQYVLSGAQPVETWLDVIDQITAASQ
ncbi:DsbA family oxidoreductase [Pararhodobacter aggregans]|uniref:Polyketide biosynthesis protein n=1 Tax=Pararhodobacter aggregans TaxID=404875 RepID=A0A2T7UPM4_9RHOB|nr:DsbA family oxidoreductase [Pararhodobacter aggregans]PTX01264.1 putative DsbA family dithiol-disulfide isomerase [Pararhodobacter aggregans]PVE46642.1 polyketide biosynthesis protein [Pararhodobacter aggregans]